jgi:hypothetical protein
MDARSRLFAEGLTPEEAFNVEREGRQATRKTPWFKTNDYGRAYAEGISYFPNQAPRTYSGFSAATLRIAKRGQEKDTFKAGRVFGDLVNLQLRRIDPRLVTPDKIQSVMDETEKAIELGMRDNPLWLQDISNFSKYAAAPMLSKGMSIDEIITHAGAMKPGYRPSTGGRAISRWYMREPEKLAALLLAGEKGLVKGEGKYAGKKGATKWKKDTSDFANQLSWDMEKDPLAVLGRAYQAYNTMRDRGRANPMGLDAKMSQNFAAPYLSYIQPGVSDDIKAKLAAHKGITIQQLNDEDLKKQEDMSTGMQKLSNSLGKWKEAASQAYGIGKAFESVAELFDRSAANMDKKSSFEEASKKIDADYGINGRSFRDMGPLQRRQWLEKHADQSSVKETWDRFQKSSPEVFVDPLTEAGKKSMLLDYFSSKTWLPQRQTPSMQPFFESTGVAPRYNISDPTQQPGLTPFSDQVRFPWKNQEDVYGAPKDNVASTGGFVESLGSATSAVGSFASAVIAAISKISSTSPASPDAPEKKPGPVAGNK